MQILDLKQGTQEWLDKRQQCFTASEAPAMKGASKYQSRNQLLHAKKTGNTAPVSAHQQKIFDLGHEYEESARPIIEMELCADLPNLVGFLQVDGLDLLASYDGLEERVLNWEHKSWNAVLAENVVNGVLTPQYYWQLEHQMLVADVNETYFTVSNGTAEKMVSMHYVSVSERRAELISSWKQFAKDLEAYEPEAKQEVIVANEAEELPSIHYKLEGSVIVSNIKDCLPAIKDRAEQEMSRILETEQDFADKDKLNKAAKAARAKLKEITASVRGEFVSYSEFEETAALIDSVLQKMQAHGEKQVKERKADKKQSIIANATQKIADHLAECNKKLGPRFGLEHVTCFAHDFVSAMKNKRTIDSWQNAADSEEARVKIEINKVMERVVPNLACLREEAEEYKFLFNDAQQLVNQDVEPFRAIVKQRIADHKQAEAEKLEQDRKRIQAEEEAKAQREAEALAEKERERIRQEEREKAQAEAKVEPKQIQQPEQEKAFEGAVSTGTGFVKEGKRVVPKDALQLPVSITKDSNPDLFEALKDGCEINTSSTPKHGKGYVTPTVTHNGVLYQYNTELVWDYSWGIEEWCETEGAWIPVDERKGKIVEVRMQVPQSKLEAVMSQLTDRFIAERTGEHYITIK